MRKRFKYLLVIILLVVSVPLIDTSTANQSTSGSNNKSVISTDQTITSKIVWEDMIVSSDKSIVVTGSSANLTIINSVIDFTNTSLIHGIILNGGHLMLIDSIVHFKGVDHAVYGESSGNVFYDNATLSSSNGDATHLAGQYDINITNSIFRDTGDDGLHVEDTSIPIAVTNSLFYNNSDDGFDLLEVGNATLVNSQVIESKGHAVKVIASDYVTIEDVYLDGTGAVAKDDNRGMDIEDSIHVTVINTTVKNFPSDGIKVQRTPFMGIDILLQNVNDEGIEFENTISKSPVTLQGVDVINANGGDGIKVEFVEGHVLINNTRVINSNDDGIQITAGNTSTEIYNTNVEGAAEDGFELDSSQTMIMQNVTSSHNSENGIKFKTIGDVSISDSSFDSNGFYGIQSGNATNFEIEGSSINNNQLGGLFVQNSFTTDINAMSVSNNRKSNIRSTGILIEGINDFSISNTTITGNSGSGINIDNSNGHILDNSISNNDINGIAIGGNSNFEVLSNTISTNGQNGLVITNGSNGLVVDNYFSSNGKYGVFVDINSDTPINLSRNFWGSNDGPIWQAESNGGRDGVFGNILINNYLDENGNLQSYTPPSEFDFRLLSFILIGAIVAFTIIGYIIYRIQVNRWIKSTDPLVLIYINRIGLPVHEYNFREGGIDPALISGFLSAVSSFGSEIYTREGDRKIGDGKIREIQSKENVIVLYAIDRSMVAMVVQNSNPVVRSALEQFGDSFIEVAYEQKGEDLDTKVSNIALHQFENLIYDKFNRFTEQ